MHLFRIETPQKNQSWNTKIFERSLISLFSGICKTIFQMILLQSCRPVKQAGTQPPMSTGCTPPLTVTTVSPVTNTVTWVVGLNGSRKRPWAGIPSCMDDSSALASLNWSARGASVDAILLNRQLHATFHQTNKIFNHLATCEGLIACPPTKTWTSSSIPRRLRQAVIAESIFRQKFVFVE